MNRQEIFNKVVAGFEAQDWRHSFLDAGHRRIAAMIKGDCRCSLGMLMDEENAQRFDLMEAFDQIPHCDIDHGLNEISVFLGAETGEDVGFLNALQDAHDLTIPQFGRSSEQALKQKLRMVAFRFGLEKPESIKF